MANRHSAATFIGPIDFSGTGHAGLIVNNLTTTQRDLLTPSAGMVIYNTTTALFERYENGAWVSFSGRLPATKTVAPASSGALADYYTDGTADDVQIQAAFDAVEALGGGSVYIASGTYDITATVTIPSNIEIFGDGETTELVANASLVVSVNMLRNEDQTLGNTNISISKLKLDGNQANRSGTLEENSGSNLHFKYVSYSRVFDISTTNGFVSNLTVGPGSHHNVIDANRITNSHWHNILIIGSTTGPVYTYNNTISNNIVDTSGVDHANEGAGIEVAKHAVRNTFVGNNSSNSKEGGIHLFYKSNENTVVGNSFYDNGGAGVYIVDESDYNTVTGNTIVNSGTTGIGATTAYLPRTGYYNVISNNIIKDCAYNGIRGSLTGSVVTGNKIYNCGLGGTSTLMHGTYILNCTDLIFADNSVVACGDRGIYFGDISNSIIKGNYSSTHPTIGMIFDYTATGVVDSVITDNVCIDNVSVGMLLFKGATRCTISNNIIRDNGGAGIDIRGGTNCTISGNIISGNTYGLDIKNDATPVATTECIVSNNTVTANTSGGIRETGSADYNTYTGNNCRGNTAANFAYVGVNNEIGHNIGV